LLDGFEELSDEDRRRLVHEQMGVLRHQDVGVDPRRMSRASLFQDGFDCFLCAGHIEQRETVKATEGDEVEGLHLLKPL
jgi:hypothetical protein